MWIFVCTGRAVSTALTSLIGSVCRFLKLSKDLTFYATKAPGNLSYDKSAKRYVAASTFQPVFFVPDADRYLTQLRSVADHTVKQEDTWLFNVASAEVMPIPNRRVDVNVLRSILSAIRRQRALKILYQSMNPKRPKPMWRWISPHALGNDGLRWHVRAYCHTDDKFTDFILSRCLDSEGDEAAENVSRTRCGLA